MESLYLAVIPAKAGIHWRNVLRDSPATESLT